MRLPNWLEQVFRGPTPQVQVQNEAPQNRAKTIVILIDGTLSSRRPGWETNVGLTAKLLAEVKDANLKVLYQEGVQWTGWWSGFDIVTGRGINRRIRAAYGALASWYQPGDTVFLIGYSRGAYAVRSLAGVIDRVGLLHQSHATTRHIRTAYRHYVHNSGSEAARIFADEFCHKNIPIRAIGVFDTVKALGVRLPLIWHLSEKKHAFHNHILGQDVGAGFHALAMQETRAAYAPILWSCPKNRPANVEQVWFRGTHGDIGGQIMGRSEVRPLSNIPLVWMLKKLVQQGLPLPQDWQRNFPTDPTAPSLGGWSGTQKFFLARRARNIGQDPSESIHPSAR